MPVKLTLITLSLALCAAAAHESAFAQDAPAEPYVVESDSSGEISSREIDIMIAEASASGERLFVVVRLGAGETSRRLNRARLYNTRQHLSVKGFGPPPTVYAEGERVVGEGRIEFYLGSRLRLVVLAERNKMPNLTCCVDYFPPSKTTRKRKSRRGRR